MSELVGNGSKWTDEDRRNAATVYAVKGSLSAVERDLDIPRTTMVKWKQSDWWDEIVGEVRHEKADEHIAQYTALVSDALNHAHATLDQASPKDALIMAATATDKARLLLNQPTSIKGTDASINEMAQMFADLSREQQRLRENQSRIENSVVSDGEPLD
jgi:hypothetical protein